MSLISVGTFAQSALGAAPSPQLGQSYTGSAHKLSSSQSGVITITDVTQNAGTIAGKFSFHTPLVGNGPFTGKITSTTVTFTVVPTAQSCPVCANVVFTGTVWPIVSMSGTWVAHLKSGGSQKGTWGVGSTWNGQVHNIASDTTSGLGIGQLTEAANGLLTGTVVIYRQNGNGIGGLTGSLHGTAVKFTSNVSCSYNPCSFTFVGTMTSFGGMSGTWSYPYTDDFPVGNGTWQVQRSGTTASV